MLKLYDTLTRSLREFTPITPGHVGMYSCGPTVYGTPHIGNLRAYIFSDTLRRTLEFAGYDVTQVINITDVGHLVSDENAGEDKLEKGARTSGKTVWEVAKMYEDQFLDALDDLNIRRPQYLPRATDHIPEQIAMIRQLTEKGFTYETSDGIYFDTQKFADYGKLSKQKLDEKEAGARVAVSDEKHHPADFALWKFCVGENAHHTMRWDFATSKDISNAPHTSEEENRAAKIGFPGWHIECSAMSVKYLGEQFDIHTGGIDHIPVHHENEIAQSECALGHPFVNYWLHNDFMTVDGGKMSKSLGNVWTLDDIRARGIDPLAFRLLCLGTHYRSKLNFTWEALASADVTLRKLRRAFAALPVPTPNCPPDKGGLGGFTAAIADDLNTPKALAVVWDVIKDDTLAPDVKCATLTRFDEVLGLGLDRTSTKEVVELTAEQTALLDERAASRLARNFARSDEIRDAFLAMGFTIEDTPDGQVVKTS